MRPISISIAPSLPINVSAKITGYYLEHPEKVSSVIDAAIRSGLYAAGMFYVSALTKSTPTGATGIARKNWKIEPRQTNTFTTVTVFNPIEYLLAIDQGRKAAPVPIEPLMMWVQKKLGIKNVKKARSVAWAISKKKAKTATPGQHFIQKTIDTSKDKSTKLINSYIKNALAIIGVEQ